MHIGADIKGYPDTNATTIGTGTLHVLHAGCAVYLLLNRCCRGLFDSFSISTGIRTIDRNTRRRNIRVLVDSKIEHADQTRNNQNQ